MALVEASLPDCQEIVSAGSKVTANCITENKQQLYYHVQFIASLFQNETERALYQRAASIWRMPYWDWAQRPLDGAPIFMEEFGLENIRIYGPNGWQLVANPLYSFHFTGNKTLNFPAEVWIPANPLYRVRC
jgi:tyrosinase